MNIDKMREEFEAKFPVPIGIWWSEEGGKEGGRYMTELAHVGCVYHQGRWEGWQASRESLAIELPKPEDQCDDGATGAIYQCIEAIEAHGLKVKP